MRTRSEWLSATGDAFVMYALQCVCQACSETAALPGHEPATVLQTYALWGFPGSEAHKVHPGAISKITTYNFPSLWTDASNVSGFSGKYFRRKI